MFHAHKTEFAEKGWMGMFLVKENQYEPNSIAFAKGERADYPAEIIDSNNTLTRQQNITIDSQISTTNTYEDSLRQVEE
jgi:hypothetical protein